MINNFSNYYFIGIGGAGMSALAGWLFEKKFNVSGFDRKTTVFTTKLKNMGIQISHNNSIEEILEKNISKDDTIIVYTPAVNKKNNLLQYFLQNNFLILKRSELLEKISLLYSVIAVAGTHGKTTTCAMLAHILKKEGFYPNAIFGGISLNFNANYLCGSSDILILEADEYDKSFLNLNPSLSIITSIDRDHVETYPDRMDLTTAFAKFCLKTIQKHQSSNSLKLDNKSPLIFSRNIHEDDMKIIRNYIKRNTKVFLSEELIKKEPITNELILPSSMAHHNKLNAIYVSILLKKIGLNNLRIEDGFKTFKGVWRRFQYHSNNEKLVLIDDYAHHPEELKFLIKSIKILHPQKSLFLIFQPHLYSRTKDLESEFCDVLSTVDKLILLDIYGARESDDLNINSKSLLEKITCKYKWYLQIENVCDLLRVEKPDLIITAGAGDIYKLSKKIKEELS